MKLRERIKKSITLLMVVCMITGSIGFGSAYAASKNPSLNKTKVTIRVGQKYKLKLKHAKAKKVKWKSSNKKIATVKKGVVLGKKTGKVKIFATYKNITYTAKVKVKKAKSKKQNNNAKEQITKQQTTEKATKVESTTKEVTTVEPTTEEVVTVEPTTVEVTTEEPTIEELATVEPTTAEPTTEEPTTEEPTTAEPTTVEPTTAQIPTDSLQQGVKMLDSMYSNENIVVSPASLNIVLGMTANGATDTAKNSIEAYLGKSTADYNNDIASLMNRTSTDDTLNINNGVWYKNGNALDTDFENSIAQNYKADKYAISMSNQDVATINKWVSDKTDGMIPSIVNSIPEDTRAILINTVLFDGKWTCPFDANYTFKKKFKLLSGDTKSVDMMSNEEDIYYENDKACGFEKTYGSKKDYSFIAVLPKQDGEFNLGDLDLDSFLQSKSTQYLVYAQLPKFDYNWDDGGKLNNYLKANGLSGIFNSSINPLANMFSNHEEAFVSSVIQKCKITVDELGTKAAAATGEIVEGSSYIDPDTIKRVYLDRPFAYMIKDNKTGQILFVGKVVNP